MEENLTSKQTIQHPFTPEPQKKIHSKWIIGILLIITCIILISGGIATYQTLSNKSIYSNPTPIPTTKPTADWQLYSNYEYGFEIEYPSTWNLSTQNNINDLDNYLIFSIYESEPNGSRIQLYKNFTGGYCEGDPNTSRIDSINLNNKVFGQKTECSTTVVLSYQQDGQSFHLITTDTGQNSDKLSQIFSTFRLTNTSSQSKTISWQEATSLIHSCQVDLAFQTHNLEVTLTLKDGSQVITTEPSIDDIFKVTQQAQAICGTIPLATE